MVFKNVLNKKIKSINMENQKQLLIKSVLDSWKAKIKEASTLIDSLTDEQLQKEIAPNKNRGTYLLGHLAAVHDQMLPILNFGKQQYESLNEPFLDKPDKAVSDFPKTSELRTYWKNANAKLDAHLSKLTPDEWFEKHASISAEDFAKEPHRNRLNVLLNRTTHLTYHVGQLALLKNK